jgi:nicotinate-nucleotide pyrophosphorylase (carboxylating)
MHAYHELSDFWKQALEAGLKEDGWPWDWTARGSLKKGTLKARLVAKAKGVWAGEALESAVARVAGAPILRKVLKDGSRVEPGTVLAHWEGPSEWVLALERPALNLAAFVSGIATQTSRLVEMAHSAKLKHPPRITSTRKTLPGYRDLSVYGVITGGGHPHRMSLSGGILIKENHIASAGSIASAVGGVRRCSPHGLGVEVEVRNLRELEQALACVVEGVLLDNFSPAQVTRALELIESESKLPVTVEVSGGIHEDNIAGYLQEGVHVISVGSLTHTVKSLDLSLLAEGV